MLKGLTSWTDDVHADIMGHLARARRIASERVMVRLGQSLPPMRWLRFRLNDRTYFYREAKLVSCPDPAQPGTAYHVNRKAAHLTVDKQATKRLLARLGVSVPRGGVVAAGDILRAEAIFDRLAGPACVKPNRGQQGISVYPGIVDQASFAEAFRTVSGEAREIVVEAHVEGEAIRFFYVRPSVTAVRLDRPAYVVGDGRRRIAALAAQKDEERRRRAMPGFHPMLLDREAERYLALQGLDLASVPAAGRRVLLRGTSNGPMGVVESVNCAGELHPSYTKVVEDFCRAIPGLRLAAIDMMVRDLGAPAAPGNHHVLELNGAPGLTSYYFPLAGPPQDVAGSLLDRLAVEQW